MYTMNGKKFVEYMENLKKGGSVYPNPRNTHDKYIMVLNAIYNYNRVMWHNEPVYHK